MKLLASILSIILLAFAFGLYMPWWTIALASFIVSVLILQSPLRSFVSGFAGIFILWALVAMLINSSNNGILAAKMAAILPLGGSAFMLIFVTAIAGGLVGGLAALTGSLLRKKDSNGRSA